MGRLVRNFTFHKLKKWSLFAKKQSFKKSIELLDDWPDFGRLIEGHTVRY
jgi:hypothetical protein